MTLPPGLAGYQLPAPPDGDARRTAIRASLGLLEVAPPRISYPLVAAVYRAAAGPTDFSVHVAGPTGAGKTELASVFQQHFGATMDARHLPGSWDSTANANEALAFAAKDAVFVVDDFMPNARGADAHRLHRDADRLLRAVGNQAGRARMRADTTLRPAKPPRACIISTGEDVPRGQSLRARVVLLELSPGDLDWSALTACQQAAADGIYAASMAGFVQWLAQTHPESVGTAHIAVDAMRSRRLVHDGGPHRRISDNVANLAVGLDLFRDYAVMAGAITDTAASELREAGLAALAEAAGSQDRYQAADDPARRFVELIVSALAAGRGHIAGPNGSRPPTPSAWGWRPATVGTGSFQRDEWRPQGERIGWLQDADLFLDRDAACAVARSLAIAGGDTFSITRDALAKRLHERGYLASTEPGRGELRIRKVLDGERRPVWHVRAATLYPPGEPAQSAHEPIAEEDGAVSRADSRQESAQEIECAKPEISRAGRIGRVVDTQEEISVERTGDGTCAGADHPEAAGSDAAQAIEVGDV